ncbi:hypothetical protein AVEN_236215-1 [Araneus ventricosus]|uniref:Uncharacterized protein n=1 Tax=Araneus ventricosus TaxID=182803 RepID=A0A4Y2CC04_ARAVE|nr:hypothetical protein AVEN_236215-1 [Araneus ventricosus]
MYKTSDQSLISNTQQKRSTRFCWDSPQTRNMRHNLAAEKAEETKGRGDFHDADNGPIVSSGSAATRATASGYSTHSPCEACFQDEKDQKIKNYKYIIL